MKTNDIKKGMRIVLRNGWKATMYDNARGNIRMAEVEGHYTEIGSIYAHDIASVESSPGVWVPVTLTPAQEKLSAQVEALF